MPIIATTMPATGLLTPQDHLLILIDHQPQMAFATRSIDGTLLRVNTALVANAAKGFGVSTIVTSIAKDSFSGPVFREITDVFPDAPIVDRTSMNGWEDAGLIAAVNAVGKDRIVLAGLWTGVCIVGPALSAIEQGYEVYVITDASGDVTSEAHERAVERMVQAGVRPITSVQYLLEMQRDWSRVETYEITTGIAQRFGGAYGIGISYAQAMFHAHGG